MCDIWWLLGWQATESTTDVLERLKNSLRAEWRKLHREAARLDQEAGKVPTMIRNSLKQGDKESAHRFAVEMARMYRVRATLLTCQNRINDARTAIIQCKTNVSLQRSMVDMTRVLQGLASLDETRQLCQTLSREMLKAGIIQQEMMDALEPDLDPEQEQEAEAIVADGDIALESVQHMDGRKAKKEQEARDIEMEADRLLLAEQEFLRTGKRVPAPTPSLPVKLVDGDD